MPCKFSAAIMLKFLLLGKKIQHAILQLERSNNPKKDGYNTGPCT
jgi:hypothetical protein